jgi:hypothetical protein
MMKLFFAFKTSITKYPGLITPLAQTKGFYILIWYADLRPLGIPIVKNNLA